MRRGPGLIQGPQEFASQKTPQIQDWQVRDATLKAMARLSVGALSCAKARTPTNDKAASKCSDLPEWHEAFART